MATKYKKPDISTPWYARKGNEIGESVIALANSIKQGQMGIDVRNWRSALMYGGQGFLATGRFSPTMIGAGALGIGGPGGIPQGAYASPRFNLIYSCVNTVLARLVAPGIPAVDIVSSNGTFEERHKAKLLDTFVEGLIYQTKANVEMVKAVRNCLIFR